MVVIHLGFVPPGKWQVDMRLNQDKATRFQKIFFSFLSISVFILIWHFAVVFTELGNIMPSPFAIIKNFAVSFVKPVGKHTMPVHIAYSLRRVLTGFVIGSCTGIFLGIAMGLNEIVSSIFKPVFEIIRPIPTIAWIPLAIIWFGIGETTKYFLIFLVTFCNVTINAYDGVRSIDSDYIGAAKMLGANPVRVFGRIILPACVPYIFAGLQTALGYSWATVVAAEMVRSSEGVGWMIITGQSANNMMQIMMGILAVGVIGFCLTTLMRVLEARLCSWRERGK